jgi:subtilase family serine protease
VHNTHDFFPKHVVVPMKAGPRPGSDPQYVNGTTKGIAPPDWAALYDVNPLYSPGIGGHLITGAGVSIAIVGIAGIAQSDINAFRTKFGLPASTVTMTLVPNTGAANGDTGGAGVEAILDTEWSGGIAPDANIIYVNVGVDDEDVDDATY